jgi:hypothetical protein
LVSLATIIAELPPVGRLSALTHASNVKSISPVLRSALSARLKYSLFVDSKSAAVSNTCPVPLPTVLLSVRSLEPWLSTRVPLASSISQAAIRLSTSATIIALPVDPQTHSVAIGGWHR